MLRYPLSRTQRTLPVAALLCAALSAVGGCATTGDPYMPPTPAVFKIESIDFEPHLPAAVRTTKVPVFFATTRAPAEEEAGHYRNAADENIRIGVAHVGLGEPGW